MTPNRRIFLNIVATYGRSLYALVIGLFCGWRTLMARWFDGGENGKIYGKGMNVARHSCELGSLMVLNSNPTTVTPPLDSDP